MDKFDLDFGQEDLFGKRTIPTIGFNEQQMIRDILYLHSENKSIDCDPCYSVGNFYKKGLPQPIYKFDKYPQGDDVIVTTSDKLPLDNESCLTIMFDPPFVIGGETYKDADEGSCVIAKRFTSFKSFAELKGMYSASLKEFYRVLKMDGIVIFKCQDCVSGGLQYFTHSWVMMEAIRIGYYPKDLFILLAKNRITDGREQQHARKYHSYYWVFKKQINKVDYLTLF